MAKTNQQNKIIFALETSCDETSAAVIKAEDGRLSVLASVVASQIEIHKKYGGVVPEVAARHHVENLLPVIDSALEQAKLTPADLDLLAVASGPGLITSLMVGVEAAKTLSWAWDKPLLAVNHMYAHLAANFIAPISFSAVCLVVSGGHTEIILLRDYWRYKKIGQTLDDAAGEAFDKVAKLLDLGYPGGPIVSAEAAKFATDAKVKLSFPRPMLQADNFDFSFSGLKTAVLYAVKKMTARERTQRIPEICYEFQQAAVEVLVKKTLRAAKRHNVKTIMLAGGVAANKTLRQSLQTATEKSGRKFSVPDFSLCTDNAAMVGLAAYYLSLKKQPSADAWEKIQADPNWELPS